MQTRVDNSLIEAVQLFSQNTLKRWAADVDSNNRFPLESIKILQEARIIGFFVPKRYGGLEGNFRTYSQIATILGEGCLSTAMIWAMHNQQVAVLAKHAAEEHADVLTTIANDGHLVASVTTEYGGRGDLLTVQTPLIRKNDSLVVHRLAPIVSYGAEADFFLVTMWSGKDQLHNDVCLVLVKSTDGNIRVTGDWKAMGMRGTQSVPMEFNVVVDSNRIIGQSFRQIALQTMIPAGHIGWTAAWLGAARGAFKRFVNQLRTSKKDKLKSDLFISRLASLRVSLDLIEALLYQVIDEFENSILIDAYFDITQNIRLNNLKIAGSQLAFSVADRLIELSGLSQGYLNNEDIEIERIFRDLRSAALMYSNDRLLEINGKMILVENSSMFNSYQTGN